MASQTEQTRFYGLASQIWPNFSLLDSRERQRRLADLVGIAYAAPLVVLGVALVWQATDLFVLQRSWFPLAVLAALLLVLSRRPFFWVTERRPGRYKRYDATLAPTVIVAALLLFGPSALWIVIAVALVWLVWRFPRTASRTNRIRDLRRRMIEVGYVPVLLVGAALYSAAGGRYPLAQLVWPAAWPALAMIAVIAVGEALIDSGYLLLVSGLHVRSYDADDLWRLGVQLLLWSASAVFGILMSTIFMQLGMVGLLFFGAAAILASVAANQFSFVSQQNIQRTRELEQLEQLGRAIIDAPPDNAALPNLLAAYVPFMFQHDQIDIVRFPDQVLLHVAARPTPVARALWDWLAAHETARVIRPNEPLPWNDMTAAQGLIIAPITVADQVAPIGGIALVVPRTVRSDERELSGLLPAVQTLAAQIGSAIKSAEDYQRVRAFDRLNQDLDIAASIQRSFLPEALPEPVGWQFAARLRPARQTSGDFYDVFELPNGHYGLLIADVADKGTGPALYMALCRTLIRTYALENPAHPDVVLWAANQRLLSDSRASLFVTAFYTTLDTVTGTLHYANAGHNPPLLFAGADATPLRNTGIPLGIEENAYWRAEHVALALGDRLVLYTDGVPEAQNAAGDFYDLELLLATLHAQPDTSAAALLTTLFQSLDAFAAGTPQYDDQTVLIVVRDLAHS